MKKISKLLMLLPFGVGTLSSHAQCSSTPDFYEDYSSATGWTTVDKTNHYTTPYVTITAGEMTYTNVADGREQRMVKQLPFTLNDKFFVSECKVKVTSSSAPTHLLMAFTENNNDVWDTQTGQLAECSTFTGTNTNQDALFCYIAQTGSSANTVVVGYKDGLTMTPASSTAIVLPGTNTYYYVRMQRTDYTTGVISVFSDAAMTVHVPGSPQCFSVTTGVQNLKYVQHGAIDPGSCSHVLSAKIDDLKLYNGQSPCPLSLTPAFTLNSVYCSGVSISVNGSASTSGSTLPINDYMWIVQQCDASGNGTGVEWWSPFYSGAPGAYTIPSAASGGPTITCGNYYKVSLVLQNCGNIWQPVSHVTYIECPPAVTLTPPTTVCSGTSVSIHAGGPRGSTFAWQQLTPTGTSYTNTTSTLAVTPTSTSTYQVTVTSPNGCSTTATTTITVLAGTYGKNISTGYDNVSGTTILPGSPDDDWHSISTPLAPQADTIVRVVNLTNGWFVPSVDAWVTSATAGNYSYPLGTAPAGHYVYATYFTLPANYNYTLNINKFGADNEGSIILDGTTIFSLPSFPTSNYTVGTTSPIAVTLGSGPHTLKVDVLQNDNVTGMYMEAYINGNCEMGKTMEAITPVASANAIENKNEMQLLVYPNPGNGVFMLETNNTAKSSVEVYDAQGKRVIAFEGTGAVLKFDLTDYPKGIYIVKVTGDGKIASKKIVLQ